MKKYEVFITSEEQYEIPVEAESEDEAIEIALNMLDGNELNKDKYHVDSGGTENAYEI